MKAEEILETIIQRHSNKLSSFIKVMEVLHSHILIAVEEKLTKYEFINCCETMWDRYPLKQKDGK